MNFDFNEDQYRFRDIVGRLLRDEFSAETRRADPDSPERTWAGLSGLGVFALLVPESAGGLGLGLVDAALVVEELGKALAPLDVASTLISTDVIARFATAEASARWLPAIARGEAKAAIAVLEPGKGYDVEAFETRVSSVGGRRVVNGRKLLVPHAAQSDVLIVVARDEAGAPCALALDRAAPGLTSRAERTLDPASGCCEIVLRDVDVDDAARMGPAAVARLMDVGATIYAGLMVGAGLRLAEITVEYAKQRIQFGRPIGSFQAVKHRCADMTVSLTAARAIAYYGFWASAEGGPDHSRAAAMAKAFCGDAARAACNDAIQLHGGMGFTWELGLHDYLRRVQLLDHAFGDARWNRERVLCQTLSGPIMNDRSSDRTAA